MSGVIDAVVERPADRAAASSASRSASALTARLERVLDVAVVMVDEFATTGYADEVTPALGFGGEKIVAEAAMLAYAASSVEAPAVRRRIEALTGTLAGLARSRAARADVALHPERAFRRAVPHVLLTALGHPDDAFDALVADRCARVLAHAADQAATVLAERDWIARVWGRPLPRGAGTDDVLARPLDLRVDSREDAYGLTHQLFYATDFGRSPDILLPRDRADILADVEALVVRYLVREDYDLTAELLMAWPQLGAPWSPAASFAFDVLADAADAVGVLPCGNVDPARLAALTGRDRTRYARATSYHTAFVWGILCALALGAVDAPAPAPASAVDTGTDAAWRAMLPLVADTRGDWHRAFIRAPERTRRLLAPMLCDAALVQGLEARDFRAVHAALVEAARVGLPRSPLRAAGEDLLRAVQAALGDGVSRR